MKRFKASQILMLLVVSVALFFMLSSEGFPRAGSGQKYRAPSRSSSSSYRRSSSGSSSWSSTRSTTYRRNTPTVHYGGTTTNRSYSSPTTYNYSSGSSSTRSSGGTCCVGGCGSLIGGVVFIVVIIFLIIHFMKQNKGGGGTSGGSFIPTGNFVPSNQGGGVEALPEIDEAAVKAQLAELSQRDPNFSEKVFLDKAQTAFFEIQRAWSRNSLEPVRKYMSEAQFNRMQMQIQEIIDKGYTNKVEDIVIGGIKVAQAGIEGEYDFIKTRVHASMSDKTLDKDGKIVEGSNEIQPMAEYWVFIRKMGAKTSQDGGRTIAHNCPNCSAPIETGESGKCPYCDATITAASFDWVLDTITQSVEE